MKSKKTKVEEHDLLAILRGEQPRWEIEIIANWVRQKIYEEHKIRNLQTLIEDNAKLSEKCESLQRSLALWQATAITFIATLIGIILGVILK